MQLGWIRWIKINKSIVDEHHHYQHLHNHHPLGVSMMWCCVSKHHLCHSEFCVLFFIRFFERIAKINVNNIVSRDIKRKYETLIWKISETHIFIMNNQRKIKITNLLCQYNMYICINMMMIIIFSRGLQIFHLNYPLVFDFCIYIFSIRS